MLSPCLTAYQSLLETPDYHHTGEGPLRSYCPLIMSTPAEAEPHWANDSFTRYRPETGPQYTTDDPFEWVYNLYQDHRERACYIHLEIFEGHLNTIRKATDMLTYDLWVHVCLVRARLSIAAANNAARRSPPVTNHPQTWKNGTIIPDTDALSIIDNDLRPL